MLGLDTNVVIRYITQDDVEQSAKVSEIFENQLTIANPGFIPLIVMVEISWVLESCYAQNQAQILSILLELLTTKQLKVEKADSVYLAIKRCKALLKADFSDALIAVISEQEGCNEILTFDKHAKKLGMKLL